MANSSLIQRIRQFSLDRRDEMGVKYGRIHLADKFDLADGQLNLVQAARAVGSRMVSRARCELGALCKALFIQEGGIMVGIVADAEAKIHLSYGGNPELAGHAYLFMCAMVGAPSCLEGAETAPVLE